MLLGGASTRFGSPKALAVLEGETLAERAWRIVGEAFDLVARAVDEGDADAQAAQQGDVEEQIAEVVRLDDGAVNRDHEDAVAILWNVTQDAAQIGQSQHDQFPPNPVGGTSPIYGRMGGEEKPGSATSVRSRPR